MTRCLAILGLALFAACGGETGDGGLPRQRTFSLTFSTGGDTLRAVAGSTTYIYVTVVGASGGAVTFQGVDLPSFAEFSVEGRLTLQPPAEALGEYVFTLSATVGKESASKEVHLTVVRSNTAPVLLTPRLTDPRGFQLSGNVMQWDCLQDPYLEVSARDVDGEPIGLEIIATPVEPTSVGTLTYSVPALQPLSGATTVHFSRGYDNPVKLAGLAPGVEHLIAFRAVDARGAKSGWSRDLLFKCFPFGISLEGGTRIRLQAGQPKTVQVVIEGTSPEPVVLTAEGLPPSATLTGTTLAFDGSTGQAGEQFQFTIIATSGGLTSRALVRGDIQP